MSMSKPSRSFGSLLKNSRYASIVIPKGKNANPAVPVQQVITAAPETKRRSDWGLKRPVPPLFKSEVASVEAIDTRMQMAELTYGTRYHGAAQRLRSTGLAFTSVHGGSKALSDRKMDPFFTQPHKNESGKLPLTRESFLSKVDPVNMNYPSQLLKLAKTYVSENIEVPVRAHQEIKATGGLSYVPSGSLRNSRNGVQESILVSGRVRDGERASSVAAIGGVVAKLDLDHTRATAPYRDGQRVAHFNVQTSAIDSKTGNIVMTVQGKRDTNNAQRGNRSARAASSSDLINNMIK
ncbi:hypothetical protein CJU89_3458 [Yarrowia sp. B02]|nr:hypothetical protein CJU89_3458 [Yarrowia sp. B02]